MSVLTETAFALRGVTYRYQEAMAVDDLSLSIMRGSRVALLGANGSGKSTLLRLLDGLYFPDQGSISFDGEPITEAKFEDDAFTFRFRRRVGLVFQNPDVQLFNPTVFDEVAFGPLQLEWSRSEVLDCVGQMLDSMDIAALRDRSPHHLSGGEKKRVALASVLVMEPDVLLLDEPTAALDPRSQSQIIDMLIGWGGGEKTVITATHDLGIVEDVADRCVVLDRGKLAADGTPKGILDDTELLTETNLIHAHRHRHPSGEFHSHPHIHRHEH